MTTLVDITGLEELVITRLRLNALEILEGMGYDPDNGNGRAFTYPPKTPINAHNLPAVYHMVGQTFQYSKATQGTFVSARFYIQRWIIYPFPQGADDYDNGHEMTARAAPFFTKVPLYYFVNRRLSTDSLADLQYCIGIDPEGLQNPIIQDSGLQAKQVAGGETMGVIDFVIPIVMSMSIRTLTG